MKINELRIGNTIKYIPFDYITEVVGLQDTTAQKYVTIKQNGCCIHTPIENIEPVLLTSEWLINLHCKHYENIYCLSVENLNSEIHFEVFANTDEIVSTIKGRFCDLIFDRIKYVHQLQNLYYSLTGRDLK